MHYQYTAKSTNGDTLTGSLAAHSAAEAARQLRERDLFVVAMKPAGQGHSLRARPAGLLRRSRVSRRDLLTLTSQLAIMSRAGVPLEGALQNVSQQCPNPALRRALERIHSDVLSGKSISTAFGNYEHIFGPSYVAGITAAEAAGRLPEVLQRLADLLRSELRMRSTLRTLLAYPVLLASVSTLVVAALVFFVLPQFAGVFEQLEIPLPFITQWLIGISAELRSRFWLWGALAAGAIVGFVAFLSSSTGRRCYDSSLLNLAFVRDVTRALLTGRALRLLGTMIDSGVPLLEGLRLTRSSIRNSLLKDFFNTLEDDVVNGRGMGNAFLKCTFVPPAAAQMMATAEQTGTLATVTQLMGEFYEEEGERRLRDLATILEPLIIIVMGVVVAVVVMSVMLPVFDFATATR